MEVARRQSQRLLDAIDELDVLEPFEAHGSEAGGRDDTLDQHAAGQ